MNKKQRVMIVTMVSVLALTIVGVTYAYFASTINNDNEEYIVMPLSSANSKVDTTINIKDGEPITIKQILASKGYTQLEYLQSTGTQYIDTGYTFKSNAGEIGIEFAYTNVTAEQQLFGSYKSSNTNWAANNVIDANGVLSSFYGTSVRVFRDNISVNQKYNVNVTVAKDTPGMYDLISYKFYTNAATNGNDFTPGPEI